MKIYTNDQVEQNSPEWFELRRTRFTASQATAIINSGAGLKTLVNEMLSDKHSNWTNDSWEGNKYTEEGHDSEDVAMNIYEMETGNKVEKVGFVELDEQTGCSPDGLVGNDGLWECKWKKNQLYFKLITSDKEEFKKADSDHYNQCQFQLYVTGRKWVDLCYYNPNFIKSMYIIRIERDDEMIEKIELGLIEAKKLLDKTEKLYTKLLK